MIGARAEGVRAASTDREGVVQKVERAYEEAAYVVEGDLAIGPEELPLVFVEGEELGGLLLKRFPASFDGDYHRLGHCRITVEFLEE